MLAVSHSFKVGVHPGCLIGIYQQAKVCRGMIEPPSCLPAAISEFIDWTDSTVCDGVSIDAVIASVDLEI